MNSTRLSSLLTAALTGALTIAAAAKETPVEEPITAAELDFFEKKIRPALTKHCFKCHSEQEGKSKGELLLDSRAGVRKGGSSGHAIVPGNPGDSLLIEAIRYQNKDLQMPPKYQLEAQEIADFEQWILMGAPDPRGGGGKELVNWRDPAKAKDFWAFKKPVKSAPPKVKNASWPKSDIDRFILAKLEEKELQVAGDADKASLVRRAYFDLLGLPPSPRTVENFMKSTDPKAFERLLDMLFESPSFGERWGRHWMDVARYAESSGKEANITFPHAWRYRDYVIKSFNEDKPYDRFIQEQIAGDLLPAKTDRQKAELIIATGFLALGPKSLNEQNRLQFQLDLVDEQIDSTSQAILGMTIACARCHDHKFDPISQREYYAMAGIFLSTDTYYGTVATQGNRRSSDLIELPVRDEEPAARGLSASERERAEKFLAEQKAERTKLFIEAREARRRGDDNVDAVQMRQRIQRLTTLINTTEARLQSVDADGNPKAFAMGVRDSDRPRNARFLERGEIEQPKDYVERGFVDILSGDKSPRIPFRSSGRRELAEWLTTKDNPLTARVMVNRMWNWLFADGLVDTVDNFGVNGKAPSHPELLDYLAVRFMENGWSVKKTLKEIMLSRTYQLASDFDARNYAKDPDNEYYWRMSKRRLDAESIRDAILVVSDDLDYEPPVGSPVARVGDGIIGRRIPDERFSQGTDNHRSVYLPVVRDLLPEVFHVFDFAEPSLVIGSRDTTTVPGQALFMLNSPFVVEQSERTAQRIYREKESSLDRINYLYMLTLGRPPNATELKVAQNYFADFQRTALSEGKNSRQAGYFALTTFCQALMASAEFRYLN